MSPPDATPRLLILLLLLASFLAGGCGPLATWPEGVSTATRLEAFPTRDLPLAAPAEVRWNQYQVPFITCAADDDLPLVLGMVHAHLRLAQMELFRHIASGRLAEIAGPWVSDVDLSLRLVGYTRAVEQMERELPPATRRWLERFCQGVNLYAAKAGQLSPELEILGIEPQPWGVGDVLAVGRLAATDVNWLFWFFSLKLHGDPAWPEIWSRIREHAQEALPSFDPGAGLPAALLAGAAKSGSNSLAVAGRRSASRAGLIANDTHVGFTLPPMWLLLGYRSPSRSAVGLSIAGLPVVVVGRNPRAAWGGTNMLALSSSLYDISDPGYDRQLETRRETIASRWWFDQEVSLRDSPLGPVLTDSPFLADLGLPRLALKWRGHMPSDETSAFLAATEASSFAAFRQAFGSYAVSGQNLLYADRGGDIGQVLALEYDPAAGRTGQALIGDPKDPAQRWGHPLASTDLPAAHNPPEGYLVSANNPPVRTEPPLTIYGNGNARIRRFHELMARQEVVSVEDLKRFQTDVVSPDSHDLARVIAAQAAPTPATRDLVAALAGWDGAYGVDSRGAAALELTVYHLIQEIYRPRLGEQGAQTMANLASVYSFLRQDLERGVDPAALARALTAAAETWAEHPTWGRLHELRLQHPLGNLPLIGLRFRFGDHPVPGSSNTIWKTAHSASGGPHLARYGANARHVSDLADPDANWFVLMGGNDGYLGSVNFLDQYPLWRRGEYIQLPLTPAAVEAAFPRRLILEPAPGSGG